MTRSKAVSAVAVVAAAALVLSACSSGGDSGSTDQNGSSTTIKDMAVGKAQSGDNFKLADVAGYDATVTVGVDEGFSAFNNNTVDTNTSYNTYVVAPVLSGSNVLDGNNKVLLNNDVLESWDVTSKDPYTVTYKIKPGVKWSDGQAWDCDDYYLAWLSQSGKVKAFNAVSTTGYELIDQATCTDDLTFVTKYTQPYVDYKGLFNNTAIMPAHILEQQTGIADIKQLAPTGDAATLQKAGEFWTDKWKGFDPALCPGSGPYKITAFDQNQKAVTLEKNPHWIGGKGGPSKIIVKAMEDTKAMATALQNGEIDVAASTQPDATAATTLKGLAAQGVTYGSASQLTFEHLDLNFTRLFADDAARKAFFQVVNRQEVVDKLLKEVQADAAPFNSIVFFPQEQGFVDQYGTKAGLGAAEAEKTLQAGGWTKGADGIYQKNGQRFSVTITHNQNERRTQTVEIIASQAKLAGIEIKNETDPNFLKGGRVSTGDYDIALFGWSSAPFKAEQKAIYISKAKGGTQNWQGLSNAKVDEAFEAAVVATDEATATKHYQEADTALASTYASLPIFQTPSMWAFKGIDRVYMQSYNGALWNAGEWEQAK